MACPVGRRGHQRRGCVGGGLRRAHPGCQDQAAGLTTTTAPDHARVRRPHRPRVVPPPLPRRTTVPLASTLRAFRRFTRSASLVAWAVSRRTWWRSCVRRRRAENQASERRIATLARPRPPRSGPTTRAGWPMGSESAPGADQGGGYSRLPACLRIGPGTRPQPSLRYWSGPGVSEGLTASAGHPVGLRPHEQSAPRRRPGTNEPWIVMNQSAAARHARARVLTEMSLRARST